MNNQLLESLPKVKNLLPESMIDIIDLIGFEKAIDLVKALGGLSFPVTRGEKASPYLDMLLEAIGEDATQKMTKVYGGQERLYIPNCLDAIRMLRNEKFRQEVLELCEQGNSKKLAIIKLCPAYGFGERHAWDILSK